ncbi:MAG TPA: hypothetical protein VN549_07195 [Negativicutes bacterium]|nr:hypothetical protein [Negativicutes bacterium]
MNHIGTKAIETEHLILRKFTLEDAENMYRNWGRVMEKSGLLREGIKRQGDRNNSGICDVVLYGLIRADR